MHVFRIESYKVFMNSLLSCITAEQLRTWPDSVWISLRKITKQKSGDTVKELTDRENWVLNAFGFLTGHIRRVRNRQACSSYISTANNFYVNTFNFCKYTCLYLLNLNISCISISMQLFVELRYLLYFQSHLQFQFYAYMSSHSSVLSKYTITL